MVDHARSSLISAGLAETLFFFFEVKDGYDYEFSYSDLGADTAGAVLAVLLDNFSRLDEMFDYRVQYFPSREYVNNVSGENFYSASTSPRTTAARPISSRSIRRRSTRCAMHSAGRGRGSSL